MFMKHGLKGLTMDAIASDLGMSKKTIYQYVDNKSELILVTLKDYLDDEHQNLDLILKRSENSIDELVQMMQYFLKVLQEFTSTALDDMQKYYPESWTAYNDYRYNFMLGRMKRNLTNGIEQGFYRNCLNPDIIARIYIGNAEMLADQQLFPANKFTYIDIFREFLNYHLRGIVSEKGLKYMEEHNLFK